jgi:hypothetical protein
MERMPQPQPKAKVEQEEREITEAEVLEALKSEDGIEDPKNRELFDRWDKQEHEKVANNPEAMIQFNLRKARMFLQAGYNEASYDMFCGARDQATSEGNNDLAARIDDEINAILAQPGPEQE